MSGVLAGRLAVLALAFVMALAGCSGSSEPTPSEDSGSTTSQPSSSAAEPALAWRPAQGLRWQVQLSQKFDPSVPADVYDVDGVDTPQSAVRTAKAAGAHMVCYFNAGAWEDWRADAKDFPSEVIGNDLTGWPGEQWLDIRQRDVLLPLMARRMDRCKAKGFEAVDPDNVDGYDNDSGFDLTKADQLAYLRALSDLAHQRGLAFGLKNATDLIPDLVDDVDFAVNEQCHEFTECDAYQPLLAAGKPVVVLEYHVPAEQACADVPRGMEVLLKDLALDAPLRRC